MARVPEELIDQIRQSVDIVDIVSDHVVLTRKGKSFLGICPFHDDSSPSMNVSQEKQIFKCFSCGAGGNSFTFLRDIENISFIEAVRKLAERAGINLPDTRDRNPEQQEAYDELYRANELAFKYFHHMLTEDARGEEARAYLENRGISREIIDSFGIGYALNAWDGFLAAATRRGFSPQALERAGLATTRQNGGGFYDRFRHRVTFPIEASTGRTVAFGARALDPDEQAKYLNSPETPVYNKSATLYGLWRGRDAIRESGQALVVEGYMDLISLAQFGVENVVASSGTALTADHARLLRRYAPKATLIFDGDAAGTSAAVRGIGSLFEVGQEARVVALPAQHDPDSYVREHGPEGFQKLIDSAMSAPDFLVEQIAKREDLSTADGKARATHELAELISRIGDQALRQFLIKDLAEKMGLSEDSFIQVIQNDTRRPPQRRTQDPTEPAPPPFDPRPRDERELIILMMQSNEAADAVLQHIPSADFSNGTYRQIVDIIAQNRKQNHAVDVAYLIDQTNSQQLSRIISDMSLELGIADPDQEIFPLPDYIRKFQIRSLDKKIDEVEKQLRNQMPPEQQRQMLEKHRELTSQKRELINPVSQVISS
ncbi:MAG: DNA primase [Candidatus Latescibacteria bacterium]|jgi:DNA primase|nr:DNA primase [Candidatus Latescibacterota bacterium]MBT5831460.1 DNA primase [Candidatus Latescibacterota bacterium]